jgi:hypothetical protein
LSVLIKALSSLTGLFFSCIIIFNRREINRTKLRRSLYKKEHIMKGFIVFLIGTISLAGVCFAQSSGSSIGVETSVMEADSTFGKPIYAEEVDAAFDKPVDMKEVDATFGKPLDSREVDSTFGKSLKSGEISASFGVAG